MFHFHVHILSGARANEAQGVIRRRALLAGAAFAARPAAAQKYPMGAKHADVRFAGAAGVTLSGTLLLPMISELQRVPGVVLVAGSGPTDRDGNNPLSAASDRPPEADRRAAGRRTASPRCATTSAASAPRRRMPEHKLEAQERFCAWDHFVADVAAAHAELLRHDEIKPYATALLGHSEGGLLSLAAAAGDGPSNARPYALVLASTPGRPLRGIVHDQIARNAPQFAAAADRIMQTIIDDRPRAGRHAAGAEAGLSRQRRRRSCSGPSPSIRPRRSRRSTRACLLLQGGADTQVVPMGDIQPLIDALGTARQARRGCRSFPMVSHNLKTVSGPADPGFAGPLAPAVADKLASWLKLVLGA